MSENHTTFIQMRATECDVTPKFSWVVSEMIRSLRKNCKDGKWQIIPHLLFVLWGFLRNYIVLLTRRLFWGRHGTCAIALLEHMGDIVAAEPVSRFAKVQYPNEKIVWIARKPYQEIIGSYPAVDISVKVHCMTEWLLLWSSKAVGNVNVWDLHVSEKPCGRCGVTFKKNGAPGKITHQTYYHFGNLLSVNCLAAGIDPLNAGPDIPRQADHKRAIDALRLPDRFVVIHCKSNEDSRDWDPNKWKALVAWIISHFGLAVIEIGSKPLVIDRSKGDMRSLCGKLRIMETAEVIRRAALFIGIDSGPAHLANAVGTPGIILLGHFAHFRHYTPYSGSYADSTGADLIRADGPAEAIPVETVMHAVVNRLAFDQQQQM